MGQLNRVGGCLYRIHTGGYYASIKVGGKQIKRSLRTNDQALAKRRLKELREKASGLTLDRKKVDFKTVAERWLELQKVDLKPASHKRRESTVKGLLPIFGREAIPARIRRIMRMELSPAPATWKISRCFACT